MQVVNAVIVVLILASLVGTTWTFVNKDCVKNASGVCGGVGAVYENNTPYDSSLTTILKLLPVFLVIGGLLYVIGTQKVGNIKI